MLTTVSKHRGQVKATGYPQTEGMLGDCMLKCGKELGEDSAFGNSLVEAGEALKLIGEVKDSLDINVKQTFIDPLQLLQDKDLKEIGVSLPGCLCLLLLIMIPRLKTKVSARAQQPHSLI